jgi:hypothetical protein
LAAAVKHHLGIKASVFKEQAKSARAQEEEGADQERQKAAKAPEDCIILPSRPVGIYEAAEKVFRLLAKGEQIFLRGGGVFHLFSDPDEGGLRN